VRPVLDSDDGETAAYAGYFLALLGEPAGIDRLIRFWRDKADDKDAWRRLVYRALAALNDNQHLSVLEEIYASYDKSDSELREFYWTIRSMESDAVKDFRGKIRQEVGMDRLR
jgi:hypothetical protein